MSNIPALQRLNADSLWEVWQQVAARHPNITALKDPHAHSPVELTYRDTVDRMAAFGAGLRSLGVSSGDKVALIADNSARWLIADQGILAIGAVNATRSSQAERQELLYILEHSDSTALVVEDLKTLRKLEPEVQSLPIARIVLLSDETPPEGVYNFGQLLQKGADKDLGSPAITRDALATLIYTSGTGGNPKGVMLTHGNLLYQVEAAYTVLQLQPGERVLSILPTWHSYERTFEYFIFSCGCTQIYTNIRSIKKDLHDHRPHYMVAVPRVWESIYEGVQKQFRDQPERKQKLVNFLLQTSDRFVKARRIVQGLALDNLTPSLAQTLAAGMTAIALWPVHQLADKLVYGKVRAATGGQVKYFVSGGGSIAEHLEDFYEIVGLPILGGYGLTETSPITHVRRPHRNLRHADGQPFPLTETRILDLETRQPLPTGQRGLVTIRGPQVMQGYYKNPEGTAKVISADKWFDTGDLGWLTPQGDLIITGRAKDTIVLTNGENIEPQAIEDACSRSPFVDQIVLVGQDQKQLGALIVPNLDALRAQQLIPADGDFPDILTHLDRDAIYALYRDALNREIKNRPGYSASDRLGPIAFVSPFTATNGLLTQTLKIRRNQVLSRYQATIEKMFA